MISAGFLAGAGIGLGLLLIVRGLLTAPPPLHAAFAALDAPAQTPGSDPATSLPRRAADSLAAHLSELGVDLGRLDADLRVVGRDREHHMLRKLAAGLVGLGLPPLAALAGWAAGVGVPAVLVVGGPVLAVVGFVVPDALVRREAAERRRTFRFALSSYFDLVHVVLAAGAGVETALRDAAQAGHGWAFDRLRGAVARSRITGESPWEAFDRLGDELDLPELREVASSLALAGTHGAKVRTSLGTRAQALRTRDLAVMEAEAESATERMSVPAVLLVVGFLVFVGFPAVSEILSL